MLPAPASCEEEKSMYEYKLTEKENFLRMFEGELPEYLPKYDYFGWSGGLPFRQTKAPTAIPWMSSASSTPPARRPWAD